MDDASPGSVSDRRPRPEPAPCGGTPARTAGRRPRTSGSARPGTARTRPRTRRRRRRKGRRSPAHRCYRGTSTVRKARRSPRNRGAVQRNWRAPQRPARAGTRWRSVRIRTRRRSRSRHRNDTVRANSTLLSGEGLVASSVVVPTMHADSHAHGQTSSKNHKRCRRSACVTLSQRPNGLRAAPALRGAYSIRSPYFPANAVGSMLFRSC